MQTGAEGLTFCNCQWLGDVWSRIRKNSSCSPLTDTSWNSGPVLRWKTYWLIPVVWPQLSPVKGTELLKWRRKKQSKRRKDILYHHLFEKGDTAALAFLILLTDFSKVWRRLRCYRNITSESPLSSLQQGARGHPSFQHFKGRVLLPMWFPLPRIPLAPPGMLGMAAPLPASQAPLRSQPNRWKSRHHFLNLS